MWDYLLWLWGHNMSTSRGFCSIEFFQFLQLPFSHKIGRSLGRSSTISGVLQQLRFTSPTLGSTSNAHSGRTRSHIKHASATIKGNTRITGG